MLFYTVGQSQIFLSMLYAGLLIGAWYDVARGVRKVLGAGPALTALIDLAFALGCAVLLALALYKANYAQLRVYALLGAACGAVLYAFTVGPLLRFVLSGLGRGLSATGRWLSGTRLIKKLLK